MDRRHQKQAARFNDLAVVRGHIVIKTLAFAALPAKLAADAGCHLAIAQLDRLSFNSGLFCSGTKMPDQNIGVPPLRGLAPMARTFAFIALSSITKAMLVLPDSLQGCGRRGNWALQVNGQDFHAE